MSQGITNVHNSKEKRFKEIHTALETMHNTAFTMVSSDPNLALTPAGTLTLTLTLAVTLTPAPIPTLLLTPDLALTRTRT